MQTELNDLKERIALWSQTNFGSQTSKADGITYGYMLPLLGIGEEIGEYDKADYKGNHLSELEDAIADIVIYLCDFTARLGIPLQVPSIHNSEHSEYTACVHLSVPYSDILHHVLKMHQGIRGYEDINFALSKIESSCTDLLLVLSNLTMEHDTLHPVALATDTFNSIVSKRNWANNPETGTSNA